MNINEIAQQAGVSRATVSRYFNNGYVSQEKRALIQRVIDKTGYVPSRRAQMLRTGKTRVVGVVIPKINSQSVSRMVEGITGVLAEHNYQTLLASTENNPDKEIDYLEVFAQSNNVDGLILIATVFTKEHKAALEQPRIPVVILGQRLPGFSCVYQDDYHALYDITRLVLPKARRPAYLGVIEEDVAAGKERHRGFLDACASMGFEPSDEAQVIGTFDADSGYFGAERILDAVPDVDTIVCATDSIAYGAMMCMLEYGRRVPEDVQVTGAGDSLLSRINRPSLTTVHLPFKRSGQRAAQLLLEHLNESSDVQHVCMPYEVYGRNSMR